MTIKQHTKCKGSGCEGCGWSGREPSTDPLDQRTDICEECGRSTASQEGICYECQCRGHAQGWFDMDGKGRIG